MTEEEKIVKQEVSVEDTVEEDTSTSVPVTASNDDKEHHIIDVPKTDIHFELDRSKSVTEQAKDLVGLAATSRAVEDEELVENITENNSITIVYPTYYDRKTHADVRLVGKGVAFTDKAKAMEYQEYMDKNIGSKWDTEYGYVFWDNQIIKLDPDKEEWQKDCDRWKRRMEEK